MTNRIERPKWILYRHTQDFDLLCEIAQILKSFSKTTITKEEKERLNNRLRELGLYNERNPELPLDAINHKINQLSYYMFGYQAKVDGVNRFIFSPLGNLLLKNIGDDEKVSKIFMAMVWSVQYEHPHGGTEKSFQLYPFRLIFKLLSDKRLDYKLYSFEVAYYVVFEQVCNKDSYEKLVSKILELRKMSDSVLTNLFQQDRHAYVNAVYEWDYYVSEFFRSAGILKKTEGEVVCRLQHGTTKTFRKVTRSMVTIPDSLFPFVCDLEKMYSCFEPSLPLNDSGRLRIDVVKEIYSFYPEILLLAIGETEDYNQLLKLPKLIEQYANNPENETAYLFENVLVEGFKMFYNVKAERLGGAGHTDIECLYIPRNKKFAVESKSTANKLPSINVGRLRKHREEIGGEYTIVITPRYVPAAKRDIDGSEVVIILANTFAEYLYNHIFHDIREIDYEDFDSIIIRNLGKDVSKEISNLTISKFATIGRP